MAEILDSGERTQFPSGAERDMHEGKGDMVSLPWEAMKRRCTCPTLDCYKLYGGRGITYTPEWDDYLVFKEWALSNGYSDLLTLDRIDVNGNYEPSNCRWATQSEQMRNTRANHWLTYQGETKTLVEWAEIYHIPYHTLKNRINRYHYTVEDALTKPVVFNKPVIRIDPKGEKQQFESISQAAQHSHIAAANISRVLHGHAKTTGGYKWQFADQVLE